METLSTKKFKVTSSAGKVMLAVFWDFQRVLLANIQKRGENTNSASYCEALLKLRDAIRRNDYARPHTSRVTQERIQQLQWELLEYPPYSPDLAPCNFHLFGPLKITLVANVSLMTKRLKWSAEML
jgi:hypothetical protein